MITLLLAVAVVLLGAQIHARSLRASALLRELQTAVAERMRLAIELDQAKAARNEAIARCAAVLEQQRTEHARCLVAVDQQWRMTLAEAGVLSEDRIEPAQIRERVS